MGNCCVSRRIVLGCCVKQEKVLKIVKSDGKVLEFTSPTLVKDVLVDFNGFVIGSSQNGSHHLPPNFELKMGRVYYMLPSLGMGSEKSSSTRRVRIVLTKKQLQNLLAQQVSMEELITQQLQKTCTTHQSSATWKPALAAIPEGLE